MSTLQFTGHCHCTMGKSYPLSFSGAHWEESHPEFKLTYPETLSRDSRIDIGELGAVMRDQGVWRELIIDIPSTPVAEG